MYNKIVAISYKKLYEAKKTPTNKNVVLCPSLPDFHNLKRSSFIKKYEIVSTVYKYAEKIEKPKTNSPEYEYMLEDLCVNPNIWANTLYTTLKVAGYEFDKLKNILVIDDLNANQVGTFGIINNIAPNILNVHKAETVYEAMVKFKEHQIDLVLMDRQLNDYIIDGITLLRGFMELDPGIIVLANSGTPAWNIKMMEFGAIAMMHNDFNRLYEFISLVASD